MTFAKAFAQSTTNSYAGLFYKRTKKRKGMGSERGYYLEPYFRVKGAWFGTFPANTILVYCPDSTILPQGAVDTYMRRLEAGQTSTIRSTPLILSIDAPAPTATPHQDSALAPASIQNTK
jgi:hypothetical protein